MDYGNLKVPENVTPEVQAILDSYEARNKEIENAHRKNTGRIWLGSALSGASAHPVFNIPYIGTGLGGALYELGQGITEGNKLPELAKRTGAGFAIGETVGAIPYAGKYANKLSGGKIGNALTAGVEKIASTPLGQKVSEIAPKVEDLLMTDITGKWIKGFHGTKFKGNIDKFDENLIGSNTGNNGYFGKGFYFTRENEYAKKFGDNIIKANLELKKPYIINNNSNIDDIKNLVGTNSDYSDFGGNTLADNAMWYISENPNRFRENLFNRGYDGVIVDGTHNEIVAFSPEQIKSGNLAEYLLKDSVLTKSYRNNKKTVDTQASKLYENLKDYNSMKPGYINLGGEDNFLDLTGIFDNKATKEEIANYIQGLVNEGAMTTKSPDYLIDVPNFRRYKKHIQYPTGYDEMSRTDKKRHNSLAMKLKEIINNSTHTGIPKANTKPDLKPNVDKYHYFTVNVKVGDEVIPVVLDAEQLIGESTIKPQTVHLYNFGEK